MSGPSIWSPTRPLRPGVTLIEASAGTGKTYNITSLVVRLVAEQGVPIERILVVTYTRAATAELGDRIRRRLGEALDALEGSERPDDEVVASVWDRGAAARTDGVARLRRAIGDFDLVLISTIHGFCQRMLQVNAFETGVAFDLELLPDPAPLVEELVDDHLSRTLYDVDEGRLAFLRDGCGVTRSGLMELAAAALADPDTEVVPPPGLVDEAEWSTAVAALLEAWPALGEDLVEAVRSAVVAAKGGAPSVLKPRQRTYTEAKTRAWVEGVHEWLQSEPGLGSEPPNASAYTPGGMAKQLVDPQVPLRSPALDALAELLAVSKAVAGAVRSAFVVDLRRRFDEENKAMRVQSYQDLLRGLARRLGPDSEPAVRDALVRAIGSTFDVALIDEFQDTDPHQWTIFREVFGGGAHQLYLIGDPKQAIYGFRGANVHVYAQAADQAGDRRFTMDVNWRSDARLLEGLNQLMDQPAAFGPTVDFGYVRVLPAPGHDQDRLVPSGPWGQPGSAPVQLRWFDAGLVDGAAADKPLTKGKLEGPLVSRVAEDVVALLGSSTQLVSGEETRPVRPGDVAILVRKGRQAVALQEALRRVGVPAVLSGASSVLASDEARELQQWLEALALHRGRASERVAASSPWFGWSAEALEAVQAEDPEALRRWDAWRLRLAGWRVTFDRRGFMAALRQALDEEDVRVRLLCFDDGERRVTNLLHVAELAHRAERQGRLRLEGLLSWLAARRQDEGVEREEAELRLDRDADAVRLLTIHKSKGLEFPVCFVPWLWDGGTERPSDQAPQLLPHPHDRARRLLDVGMPPASEHVRASELEGREEALRLAYVALTRARHRCVVYGGWATDYERSPLAVLLHGSGTDRIGAAQERVGEGADVLWADVEALVVGSAGPDGASRISATRCGPATGLSWSAPTSPTVELSVRAFTRTVLDPGWRRHSYTSVVRAAGHPELVEEGREGFDADAEDDAPRVATNDGAEVPLAAFPGGAEAGTLLHEVFEEADFAWVRSEDEAALDAVVVERLQAHGFEPERYRSLLVSGLQRVFATPLGAVLGDQRLQDVARRARLDELRFDLPILGGTRPPAGGDALEPARQLVAALRRRVDGPLPAEWLESLDRLEKVQLAGFLAGSIDLVFQAPEHDGRWFVVDYKSNRLNPRGTGRCVADAFSRGGMTAEMARHDYFLQYHLYLVALHRFLRWRLPDYDYDRHVGGAYYLFFRGMVGAETARVDDRVHGCWFDRPPREVVQAIDEALTGPNGEEGA